MGKRKSARKPGAGKTKMAPLDKSFKCLFCQHTGTVTCKIDNKKLQGRLDCKDCGQTFTCDTNHLTEPVDIYSEWLDACQEVNPPNDVGGEGHEHSVSPPPAAPRRLQKKRPAEGSDDEAGAGGGGGSDEEEDLPDFRRKKGRVERSDDEGEGEEAEPRRKQQVVEDDEDDE